MSEKKENLDLQQQLIKVTVDTIETLQKAGTKINQTLIDNLKNKDYMFNLKNLTSEEVTVLNLLNPNYSKMPLSTDSRKQVLEHFKCKDPLSLTSTPKLK